MTGGFEYKYCIVSRSIPSELRELIPVLALALPEWDSSGCEINQDPPLYRYIFEVKGDIPTTDEFLEAEKVLDKALHWMWEISKAWRMVKILLPEAIGNLVPTWGNFQELALEVRTLQMKIEDLQPKEAKDPLAKIRGKVDIRCEKALERAYRHGYCPPKNKTWIPLQAPIEDLNDDQLLAISGIGEKSLKEIRAAIQAGKEDAQHTSEPTEEERTQESTT